MIFTEAIKARRLKRPFHDALDDVITDPDVKEKALKYFGVTGAIDMDKVELVRYRQTDTYILKWEAV